jgi:hypothetical protein
MAEDERSWFFQHLEETGEARVRADLENNRWGERRQVRIQSTDPSQPVPLNNTSPF